ncbi:DUF2460 domain-containing protein [Neomegalonema sp.]|uniref:DUF2460 domain-containing protein n=1 Tax=Neomegalonema sp. TaxID=2039713 RepID=UPI00262ED50F|nr:DUF2460 domain-containing protein [Neomegalonema sp.]MDD2869103.1 DUF2460 domain-containing protein [Neomegalonema sp.]
MTAFHEIRFPTDLSFGSVGGPERRTRVVTLASGREERQTPWRHSRRRYDAGLGLRRLDDLHALVAFFEARRGRLHGFRWKDWLDFKSCAPSQAPSATDQLLGFGDGSRREFQLVKAYLSGSASYERPIFKPLEESLLVAVEGAPAFPSLDPITGLLSFPTPPPEGARVTAGFLFDTPVRFDTDRLEIDLAGFEAGAAPSIPIIEIRP